MRYSVTIGSNCAAIRAADVLIRPSMITGIRCAAAPSIKPAIVPISKVGGFEIGTMAGLMLGAAAQRIPVIIDGLISTSAALIAAQFEPMVTEYLIAGHRSVEPGHQIALEWLGLTPLLDLDLRLGEGTGAVL